MDGPWINHGWTMSIITLLTKFEQFMMVLLKLRCNLEGHDIAYHFDVHQTTVSREFGSGWAYFTVD